jgi:hypothetical protein
LSGLAKRFSKNQLSWGNRLESIRALY